MRVQKYLPLGAFIAATAIAGCGSNNNQASTGPNDIGGSTSTNGTGGTHAGGATGLGGATGNVGGTTGNVGGNATGGAATGGANVGGNATGGAATGGANVGGNATGGKATGGANVGGNSTGGAATGGANVGGNATGGAATGGANVGGNATGGKATGGANVGGNATGGKATGGANVGGNATGGAATGGANVGGNATGGAATGGANTTGGQSSGGGTGCSNTDTSKINLDASGYVCNNTLGIKGAWYCYSDGSDSSISCKGSDGKGAGAIPWNATSGAMCLSGTMGVINANNNPPKYAGIGFKVNSGPPGSTGFSTWNASNIVGFAITLTSGPSGKGSGGMVLDMEYPTTTDQDTNSLDAPGVTVPGVAGTSITYNALFADSVLANNKSQAHPVDPANLTDVKIAFFPDSVAHTYDFCITKIVPITSKPNPVVATGAYGPAWSNQLPQAVNGINGYAVQSAPFPTNGNPMTMQISATASGVGFTYATGSGYQAPNNGPGSFPAIISGWGPGHDGIQFYGPYGANKTAKQISALTSVKSSWSYTMGSSGDAVYDVWFGNSASPTVPQVELMIWMGNKDKNPLGSIPSGATAVVGSDGVSRTPYVGTNGTGEKVVSYWVPTGTNGGPVTNFDLLPYFKDAANHSAWGLGVTTGSYLLGVQTGFEVYSGTWTTTDYNITIQ